MPVLEGLQVSAESKAIAFQAHVQRCQDRIAAWQAKLEELARQERDPTVKEEIRATIQSQRDLILEDLVILERQLKEPFTRRTLEHTTPGVPMREEAPNPLMALVLSLKAQLESLKTQLTGGAHGPAVPEREATPTV